MCKFRIVVIGGLDFEQKSRDLIAEAKRKKHYHNGSDMFNTSPFFNGGVHRISYL